MKFLTTPYDGTEFIEIPITSVNQFKYNFPVVERLDNKIIRRVELYHRPSGKTPQNRTNISKYFVLGFLSLRPKNEVTLYRFPLYYTYNYGGYQYSQAQELLNYPVRWELSFVEFAQSMPLSIAESLVFIVYYQNRHSQKNLKMKFKKFILNPLYRFFLGYESFYINYMAVKVNSLTSLKYFFPLDEKLEKAPVLKIELVYDNAKDPGGNTIISSTTILQSAYLVLRDLAGNEFINNLPLLCLSKKSNQNGEIILNKCIIDWTKSYIRLPYDPGLVLNTVFGFNVYYIKR